MILGRLAVIVAAFPVNFIQENKKFAKMEEVYLYAILTQIANSMSIFFFSNPQLKNRRFSRIFSSFFLMSSNNKFSQSQEGSQVELDKYNQINFFNYIDPGIYQITCLENGKVYIGEAKNLLDRMNKHFLNLENGLSDCYEL